MNTIYEKRHQQNKFLSTDRANIIYWYQCTAIAHIRNSKKVHLPNHLMLGSTLATVPGVTVDWNCKGLMTFPRLLLEAHNQHEYRTYFKYISDNQELTCTRKNLPSLLLSVHIQTLDSCSVPHVVPSSAFGPIYEIHERLLIHLLKNVIFHKWSSCN